MTEVCGPRPPSKAEAYERGKKDAKAGRPYPVSRIFDRWPKDIQIVYERARLKSFENWGKPVQD